MREFCAQVMFAAPLVTGIKVVRGDVQRGTANLRELVTRNRWPALRGKKRWARVYQVTIRSAGDAKVEDAIAEPLDEATEAAVCVPLPSIHDVRAV